MSSLWTPAGEHPLRPPSNPPQPGPARDSAASGRSKAAPRDDRADAPDTTPPADPAELARIQRELAATPPEMVIASHCYGLFELANVYLTQGSPDLLASARLAIDALGSLVEGLAGRLGEQEPTLREALAQIRLAYVRALSAGDGEGGQEGGTTTTR